jgi:hypothetical protein
MAIEDLNRLAFEAEQTITLADVGNTSVMMQAWHGMAGGRRFPSDPAACRATSFASYQP